MIMEQYKYVIKLNAAITKFDYDRVKELITYVLRTIRKCGLYQRKTKMVATSQKCGTHF